jgi:hypothetical protein
MPRKPNYQFERMQRERIKANKTADKADAKREQRARERAEREADAAGRPAPGPGETQDDS